jgi:hypothetical protein
MSEQHSPKAEQHSTGKVSFGQKVKAFLTVRHPEQDKPMAPELSREAIPDDPQHTAPAPLSKAEAKAHRARMEAVMHDTLDCRHINRF